MKKTKKNIWGICEKEHEMWENNIIFFDSLQNVENSSCIEGDNLKIILNSANYKGGNTKYLASCTYCRSTHCYVIYLECKSLITLRKFYKSTYTSAITKRMIERSKRWEEEIDIPTKKMSLLSDSACTHYIISFGLWL